MYGQDDKTYELKHIKMSVHKYIQKINLINSRLKFY
jgi:hypothetical protein